ncbi:glycosyltransferase family 2 protein [Victivallis sp. Marseille-Q1083]|uniref:glycosyltransferase family 2 protein n=1 Tax=Victivallis sp. Marseille-Q1083 TaxID=2717288 RepID=UPI00158A3D4E|nr:glycosyltransferase family A protein [Victivallis sp. Marseille-Q1083]
MKISVVIRSHNDQRHIAETMRRLQAQQGVDFELYNIDDHSTDGTLEIIRSFNVPERIVCWPAPYVPGAVLNAAARLVPGDVVVFNNADCRPLDDRFLARLMAPFPATGESKLAAVFANQRPRPDARPLIRKDYERAFGDGKIAASWRHFFSLAAAAMPRQLLLHYPFDETLQYSEDIEWSWRLRQRGFGIRYVPEALVEHSHNYTLAECRKRFYNEGVAEYRIFGEPARLWRSWLLPCAGELLRDFSYLLRHGQLHKLPYEFGFRLVQRRAAYCGRRDAERRDRG